MRKPISVLSSSELCLIVICDDGSIWELYKDKWNKLPDIPQDNCSEDMPQMLIKQN